MNRITRVEIIDENGRSYVNWEDDNNVSWQFQDDGRTLKVFVNKVEPKTGEEEALEALEKFQNDWLLGKKCPETKLEIKNLNSVESIKAEIKVLQAKLELLKEIENFKSPVEEAYKKVYGAYPPTTPSVSNYEDNRWKDFQNGYNASKVSETPQERGERVHKETEELITKIHDGYRVVEYQPTPQEPEELKTLYQMWNDGECRDDICYLVKEWMSQYADNVLRGECKKGYEYCLTVLEENLK